MARQQTSAHKPNFERYKAAKSGGREVKGSAGKQPKNNTRDSKAAAVAQTHTVYVNTKGHPNSCRCVSCLIADGDIENTARICENMRW